MRLVEEHLAKGPAEEQQCLAEEHFVEGPVEERFPGTAQSAEQEEHFVEAPAEEQVCLAEVPVAPLLRLPDLDHSCLAFITPHTSARYILR
ncbi:hypothetical protein ACFL3V_00550 [Nanoarchaeota archaeon]